eukprot:1114044-Prorocentrum_minimum.AAC.1
MALRTRSFEQQQSKASPSSSKLGGIPVVSHPRKASFRDCAADALLTRLTGVDLLDGRSTGAGSRRRPGRISVGEARRTGGRGRRSSGRLAAGVTTRTGAGEGPGRASAIRGGAPAWA